MFEREKSIIGSYIKDPAHWIDNIKWRLPRTVSDLDIVFVMGAPRSGTTLIQKILESHDKYFSIQGETGMFSMQNIFDVKRRHFGFDLSEQQVLFRESRDIVDFFDKSVKKLSSGNGNKIFVEKTPQHSMHLRLLLMCFPNAKFVHIVRDGRDCFCSAKKHHQIPQRKSVEKFSKYWKKCVAPPFYYRDRSNVFTVKYEDFTNAPQDGLRDLMGFLGNEMSQHQLDPDNYGVDRRAETQNFSRLKSEITSASVNRWKTELEKYEIQVFDKIAGNELRNYGYM